MKVNSGKKQPSAVHPPRPAKSTILPPWFSRSPAARALAGLYGAAISIRNTLYDRLPSLSRTAPRPVVSVGGIRMGGTGKTPVALLVAKYLMSKSYTVAFLSRGYRRSDPQLRIVKPHEKVPWEIVGDEPWLLHNRLPESWLGIHPDRSRSAALLAGMLPEHAVFVLDDGFQHRSIRRNLDIVCLHALPWTDRLAPAGNLRESAASLARAHIALLIGTAGNHPELERGCNELMQRFPGLRAFSVIQKPGLWVNAADGRSLRQPPLERPLLVCGIARPERFIEMVRDAGIIPGSSIVFPDHHQYIANDFDKTRKLYSKGIITTEKDAVRLRKLGIVPDSALWYLTIELQFESAVPENDFNLLIDKHIS